MTTRRMAITRTAVSVGATLALVAGVTFANLSSTATLSDNNLTTASADLKVDIGAGPQTTQPGFNLTDYVPGAPSQAGSFSLVNQGGVPLNITAHVPSVGAYSGFVQGGFSGVHVEVKDGGGNTVLTTTLAALLSGQEAFTDSPLPPGSRAYTATVNIDSNVLTGSSASINHFDIVFTGTQP